MATNDIFGGATFSSSATGYLDASNESYLPVLQALLPRGSAWTREPDAKMTLLLAGLSRELSRVARRGLRLIEEADPRTTIELLEEWERFAGLPSDCVTPTTLADRRTALIERLVGVIDQSEAAYIELGESLGYNLELSTYDAFRVGTSRVGDRLTNDEWQFVVDFTTMMGENDELLQCIVEGRFQLHGLARFFFTLPGAEWTLGTNPDPVDLYGVAYGPGVFTDADGWVIVGQGGLIYSSAGGDFSDIGLGGSSGTSENLRAIVRGADRWVVVGDNGTVIQNLGIVANDAWTIPTSLPVATPDLRAVAYNGSCYIAVGDQAVWRSDDGGDSWDDVTIPEMTDILTGVAFGNGRWIAVDDDGGMFTSDDDGFTWVQDGNGPGAVMNAIAYKNRWHVALADGTMQASETGIGDTWYEVYDSYQRFAIADGPGDIVIAVGEGPNPEQVSRSADGVTFESATETGTSEILRAVARNENVWVAVGDNGTIITSGE